MIELSNPHIPETMGATAVLAFYRERRAGETKRKRINIYEKSQVSHCLCKPLF